MERYWLNIILINNIDIDSENVYNQYKNLRLISSYININKIDYKKKLKIKNKNVIENKNVNKDICECTFKEICITNDLNKLKKCKNYNNFINKNPILELLFIKKNVNICYIPNTNILEDEYKKEIINNIRSHMDFINIFTNECKIVFIISMFDCLIQHFNIVKNNEKLLKISLEKLYEIDNCISLNNSLKNYDFDQNIIKNFINVYIQNT
jgi:hypothetical protein